MKPGSLHTAVLVFLPLFAQCRLALALDNPYVDIQTVDAVAVLEAEISQRTSAAGIALLVAGLRDGGADNELDFHRYSASETGVTHVVTRSSVDSGQLFSLGDFCVGPNYAVLPYINDGFKVKFARWNLATNVIAPSTVTASATSTHTTTDCSVLDDGTFVISATNYIDGTIDYYSSANQGASWGLDYTYVPSSGAVEDPFDGGYRASADAVGNRVGSVFQNTNGMLSAISVDLSANSHLGPVPIYSHPGHIGNGFLKECAGLYYGGSGIGLCNSGTDAWAGWMNVGNGSLGTLKLNDVSVGSIYSFQGVTLVGGYFGGLRPQYHFFTDQHRVVLGGSQGWGNPMLVPDYPFAGHGGPVQSTMVEELSRIFVVGIGVNTMTNNPYFGIATMSPAKLFSQIFASDFELPHF